MSILSVICWTVLPKVALAIIKNNVMVSVTSIMAMAAIASHGLRTKFIQPVLTIRPNSVRRWLVVLGLCFICSYIRMWLGQMQLFRLLWLSLASLACLQCLGCEVLAEQFCPNGCSFFFFSFWSSPRFVGGW